MWLADSVYWPFREFLKGSLAKNVASFVPAWSALPSLAGAFALCTVVTASWILAEDEVPLDLADYLRVSFRGAIASLIVSAAWLLLFRGATEVSLVLFHIGANVFPHVAIVLGGLTVVVYALVDELL